MRQSHCDSKYRAKSFGELEIQTTTTTTNYKEEEERLKGFDCTLAVFVDGARCQRCVDGVRSRIVAVTGCLLLLLLLTA